MSQMIPFFFSKGVQRHSAIMLRSTLEFYCRPPHDEVNHTTDNARTCRNKTIKTTLFLIYRGCLFNGEILTIKSNKAQPNSLIITGSPSILLRIQIIVFLKKELEQQLVSSYLILVRRRCYLLKQSFQRTIQSA